VLETRSKRAKRNAVQEPHGKIGREEEMSDSDKFSLIEYPPK